MDERLIRAVQRGKIDEVRELLPSVANLDEEFPHNFLGYLRPQDATLLAVAAESQSSNSEIIALLLTAGATADHCSLDCVPALCWACQVGDAKKVQVLLKAGATPWPIRVFSDNSVTIEVVYQRFSQLSEKLGETVSISEERIPLFMAAKSGCSHCVQLILDAGFPVTFAEKQFGRSRTVMHLASSQEVITTLLHAGAEPCYDDFMHFDPLKDMLSNEDFEGARAFLDAVPAPARSDLINRMFVLMSGCDFESIKVLEFLLDLGADTSYQLEGLGSALQWFVWQGATDVIDTDGLWVDCLNLFIEHGADPNLAKEGGTTPLHDAVYGDWGNATATKFLIDHCVNTDAIDDEGNTPLILACDRGELPCVELLLGARADRRIVAKDGSTALSKALRHLSRREKGGNAEELAKAQRIVDLLEGDSLLRG